MEEGTNIAPINGDLNVAKNEVEEIKQKIFTIRGKQVMLDSDLAKLYNCKNGTKSINQAVKRNIERFPKRFMFQLNDQEYKFCGPNLGPQKNVSKIRKLPYVFTEQGVAMLATVLRTNKAVDISIKIMDAFVAMRKFIATNELVFKRLSNLENKLLEYDEKFEQVFNAFEKNMNQEMKQQIFFQGQIWDSYSVIIDIIKKANKKMLIIDNYIDDSILKMLVKKNKNVEVTILTSAKSNISKLDIQKFNKEYPILKLAKTEKFHDRFIIIDDKELYHLRSISKGFR